MAEISAQMVKALREKTGAGMMECKKALTEANGDGAAAEILLRKKGIAAADKKASRAARQGNIGYYIDPGSQLGVLVEVNCETDFVARTDAFQDLVRDIAMQVAEADPKYLRRDEVPVELIDKEKEIAPDRAITQNCLMEQSFVKDNTVTIEQLIKTQIAALQENIAVARFARFKVGETADPAEVAAARQGNIGYYIHPGSQLGVLVEVNCETDFVARTDGFQGLVRDIAMQIAAADPKYLRRDEVPADLIAKEQEIARDRAINEKKPEKAIGKIVEGRLNKFYEENCLMEQPFVKDNTVTIEQLIKAQIAALQENIAVARFARFKVGETAAPAEPAAE